VRADRIRKDRCPSVHRLHHPDGSHTDVQCQRTAGHDADGSHVFAYHLGPRESQPEGGRRLARVWTDSDPGCVRTGAGEDR